jgi:hypothetical protein
MQWLSPWAWLGLGALAVPVFVHLFSRRPARSVAFPSLRFLALSPLTPTRRTRLSDWPLLLVRLLVLALAVAALAQPTRSSALDTARGAGTTLIVVERGVTAADTLVTDDLQAGMARAVARLRTVRGPRTIEVRARFRAGTLDSAFLAALPRDLRVVLTPVSTAAAAPLVRDSITWRTALSEREAAAVVEASQSLGGVPVRVVRAETRGPVRLNDVPDDSAGGGVEVVTAPWSPDSAQREAAGAMWSPRVAEALMAMSRDEALRAAMTQAAVRDTVSGGAPATAVDVIPIVRNEWGEPVVVARTIVHAETLASGDGPRPPDATGSPSRLRLTLRADETPERALALLLAASPAPAATQSAAPPLDRATLTRWERLPAGAEIGAGDVPRDVHTAPTDARWWWLAVLLTLGVEWLMRRRRRETRA